MFNSQLNLITLRIEKNYIKNLRHEWFQNLTNLKRLYLTYNLIEELPKNIFSPLKKVENIVLGSNMLKVIHSESFGILPNLTEINFYDNMIDAIDENFIDNTRINSLHLGVNSCFSAYISDDSESRSEMRQKLQKCFENYQNMIFGKIFKEH